MHTTPRTSPKTNRLAKRVYEPVQELRNRLMNVTLTNRGLLRAVILAFVLLLVYRFLAMVAATVLLLGTGLLVVAELSAPVEVLHRRKVPSPVAVALIVGVGFIVLVVGGYLLLSTLTEQASQLISSLPKALSQLGERARGLARELGVNIAGGDGGVSRRRSWRALDVRFWAGRSGFFLAWPHSLPVLS
jgi:hypothetical protein